MTYNDGSVVRVGHKIKLWNGEGATVVLSVDTDEETPEFRLKDWEILEDGVLVKTNRGALIAFHDMAGEEFSKVE